MVYEKDPLIGVILIVNTLIVSTLCITVPIFYFQQMINQEHQYTNTIYTNVSEKIENLTQQISYLNSSFQNLTKKYEKITIENKILKNENKYLSSRIKILNKKLESMPKSPNISLPTYNQLVNFVYDDDTNTLEYIEKNNKFICTDFANRFIHNFAEKGFFSCVAELYFPDNMGHSIVAVKTLDKGIYYVEPQDDTIIKGDKLKIGVSYCDVVGWSCRNRTAWNITKITDCFNFGG